MNDLKNFDFKGIDLKDQRTQILLLVVLVTLIVAVLYLSFVFVPQVVRVFKLTADTAKMRSQLNSARVVIGSFEKMNKDLEEQSQKVESYEKKLPAEQEIPALLENLSNIARGSNIKIIGIAPVMSYFFRDDKSVKEGQIYREIPILITAKSGYHELGSFLDKLENSDRFMKAADIDIKSNKASPNKHDVELLVSTYVLLTENK